MQDRSCRPTEHAQSEMWLTMLVGYVWYHRGVRVSLGIAVALLAWDAVLTGSFVVSFIVCPVWFLLSTLKNAIQRPDWKLALLRATIPALTLGVVLTNDTVQLKLAASGAARIIRACEEFHAGNGRFPSSLDELVPEYMSYVPRAKYCLWFGEFLYWNLDRRPLLAWYAVPPYGRKIYNFDERRWSYLD